jgi:hypothetical protein
LKGSRRGDRLVPGLSQEVDSDQLGTPSGVLATVLQDGVQQVRTGCGIRAPTIIQFEARGPPFLKSTDQPLNRRTRQPKGLGDLARGLPLLPTSDQSASYRDRDGAWHGVTSG